LTSFIISEAGSAEGFVSLDFYSRSCLFFAGVQHVGAENFPPLRGLLHLLIKQKWNKKIPAKILSKHFWEEFEMFTTP
jgi:hypothetical protein